MGWVKREGRRARKLIYDPANVPPAVDSSDQGSLFADSDPDSDSVAQNDAQAVVEEVDQQAG